MKTLKIIAFLISCLLCGCHTVNDGLYAIGREFYSGNINIKSRTWNGFLVQCPVSWGLIGETHFDGSDTETEMMIGIYDYEWSPVVQFNKLSVNVRWAEDITRLDAELSRRQELEHIKVSEVLTFYNKFTGHSLRKVGISHGRRSEYIIFYPENELSGTRVLVLLYGSPNSVSLKELAGVIQSVTFEPRS